MQGLAEKSIDHTSVFECHLIYYSVTINLFMKKYTHFLVLFLSMFFYCNTEAQIISEAVLQRPWKAQWITAPGASPMNQWIAGYDASLKEYGVYKFRKNFQLETKPTSFVIHVSADNRYK